MSMETVLAGASLVSGAGLMGWWWWRSRRTEVSVPIVQAAKVKQEVGVKRPPNQIPILDAATLFNRTHSNGVIARIRQFTALNEQNFETDVMPLLNGFAEFVQLLPASESHHHAQPGGLLDHTLEVASHALCLRQGQKLPLGATPEEQMRLAPVWSYGVLVAAMLHDIGKPVTDVVIEMYGTDMNQSAGRWNGLAGGMRQAAERCEATHYTVGFPAERGDYAQHKRLPAMMLHAFVPKSGLQWLATDPQLMAELMEYLSGEEVGQGKTSAIRKLITEGDALSVSENLMNGTRTRFASARHKPLIERLMEGLRAVVQEEHLAVNRAGAPMFIDPDGQHAWIVSKIAADKTRELLDQRETRADGAAGLPTDNERFFDTWSEYGALVQTPERKAVWKVRIQIGDWNTALTVLKFPVDQLWKSDMPRPKPLEGTINLIATGAVSSIAVEDSPSAIEESGAANSVAVVDETGQESAGADSVDAATVKPSDSGMSEETWEKALAEATGDGIDLNQPLPSRPALKPAPQPKPDMAFLSPDESASSAVPSAPIAQAITQPIQAAPPRALYKPKNSGKTPRPNADAFMAWLQQGLGTGDISYNDADAFVHFVPEGMLIVTPKAMKEYLLLNKFQGPVGSSKEEWKALQAEIQKAGYAQANQKSMFHKYRTTRRDGTPGTEINCYLIPNPQSFIRPVPAPNEALTRCEPESKEKP